MATLQGRNIIDLPAWAEYERQLFRGLRHVLLCLLLLHPPLNGLKLKLFRLVPFGQTKIGIRVHVTAHNLVQLSINRNVILQAVGIKLIIVGQFGLVQAFFLIDIFSHDASYTSSSLSLKAERIRTRPLPAWTPPISLAVGSCFSTSGTLSSLTLRTRPIPQLKVRY